MDESDSGNADRGINRNDGRTMENTSMTNTECECEQWRARTRMRLTAGMWRRVRRATKNNSGNMNDGGSVTENNGRNMNGSIAAWNVNTNNGENTNMNDRQRTHSRVPQRHAHVGDLQHTT